MVGVVFVGGVVFVVGVVFGVVLVFGRIFVVAAVFASVSCTNKICKKVWWVETPHRDTDLCIEDVNMQIMAKCWDGI